MGDKESKCPWCGKIGTPKKKTRITGGGEVTERICASCNQLLSAYSAKEGDFLPKIRVFENTTTGGDK
jgi:phage FluMu protein Com